MKKTYDIEAAIGAVEKIRAEAKAGAPGNVQGLENWTAYHLAGDKAVQRLVDELGARTGLTGAHDRRLILAGVTTTCTSGSWNLIGNWLNAAHRKLVKPGS